MSGIGLFLTRRLFGPEEHPRGWDKFVYDDENIHYGMLHLLCQSSGVFVQRLLDLPAKPERVSVVLEPERGLFDLLFVAGRMRGLPPGWPPRAAVSHGLSGRTACSPY